MVCSYDGHIYKVKDGSLSSTQEFQGDVNAFVISNFD